MKLIEQLESNGEYTRAAALAVFNLRIRRAIECLTDGAKAPIDKGGDPYFNIVAMALSGFNDKNSLWKEISKRLRKQMTDHYLKAIFTFLTCDNEHYQDILVSDCRKYIVVKLSDSHYANDTVRFQFDVSRPSWLCVHVSFRSQGKLDYVSATVSVY